MDSAQKRAESDRKREERHLAAMDRSKLFNNDLATWQKAFNYYRKQPAGGPTIRTLEGNVWAVPGLNLGMLARLATQDEEQTFLAAGFIFLAVEKGFRAKP